MSSKRDLIVHEMQYLKAVKDVFGVKK